MAEAKVQVNVRMAPELHLRLLREAGRQQRTVTDVVTEAVRAHLDADRRGKGKA